MRIIGALDSLEHRGRVDHFYPKSVRPDMAYEWSNFRLASLKLNCRKREFQDVLDPFTIEPGWFCLSFPSLLFSLGQVSPR